MPDRIEGGESLQNHRSQSGNNNSHFITGSFLQGHKTLQYPQFLRKGWVRGASFFAARNALFQKISRQAGIRALDGEDESWPEQEVYSAPPKKPGLLTNLMALVTGVSPASHSEKKHSRHCDGNCANCPHHYGYRYGRWYYGKSHQYGCEFGGNKGSKD